MNLEVLRILNESISICQDKKISIPKSINQIIDTFSKLKVKLKENFTLGLCHNNLNLSNIILNYDFLKCANLIFEDLLNY